MRHLVQGRKLKRKSAHRKQMLLNMAMSLFKYEKIQTTISKAKELRKVAEPMITRAKDSSMHNKRVLSKRITDRKILIKLFDTLAPQYKQRNGGYTRILRLSHMRAGDQSQMAVIELVEKDL